MTETMNQDAATQILIQIRDEARAMRASFERRFDALESRLDSFDARLSAMEGRLAEEAARVNDKVDRLQTQMDFLQGRIDTLEERLDFMESRGEERREDLIARFALLQADLKKFASVTNTAILHYAEEMDKVRDRLTVIEGKPDIPHAP